MNSTPITARIAQPWRWLPTMRPNTLVRAAPSAKIEIMCTKFDNAAGFSNGCAALALKKPPPFFFQAEDGIRDWSVTGVQTCALPISPSASGPAQPAGGHGQSAFMGSYDANRRSEERRVGKECRSRWSPYH